MKHKHADLIKAWADGAEIQYKGKNLDGAEEWIPTDRPAWVAHIVYRVKPESKWYRVARTKSGFTLTSTDIAEEHAVQNSTWFDKWLTDRIEYE